MLSLRSIEKTFLTELGTEKRVFKGLNLDINNGEFITVIGSNGAGKSTLLDTITGNITPDSGKINIDGKDITDMPKHKRGSFISKVYQNPSVGTAPSMTIEENLSLAYQRGKHFSLTPFTHKHHDVFVNALKDLDIGLEDRLTTKVGTLSGGQRQALTLLMATLVKPQLLLLDEHTAALDPATSIKVMKLSERIAKEHHITTMMITHDMEDALKYGNRILMMKDGKIIADIDEETKKKMTVEELVRKFTETGEANDRVLLH